MNSVLNSIKRFIGNKNTVTIIGVILGILVLYIGYNWRVNQAITPVQVPYAKMEIPSRTVITEDMIGYMQVPQSMVSSNPNMITQASQLLDKRVSYGNTIPANSLFYQEVIMTSDEMPDSAFADIPDNYTIFSLHVDLNKTYGNSIFPGNFIDLYFKGIDETQKVIYGKLIESIRVLAVKDSQGQHVFESTAETRIPSELLFAVPDDMYLLLMKAGYITGASVEINPVPRNASYSASPGETAVTSDYIRNFILAKTAYLPENDNPTVNETNPENNPGQ